MDIHSSSSHTFIPSQNIQALYNRIHSPLPLPSTLPIGLPSPCKALHAAAITHNPLHLFHPLQVTDACVTCVCHTLPLVLQLSELSATHSPPRELCPASPDKDVHTTHGCDTDPACERNARNLLHAFSESYTGLLMAVMPSISLKSERCCYEL